MDINFDGLKVMVIDDSKTIRRTAEMLLQKAGCDVSTAVDGFEALAQIANNAPDIIFIDVMMPRLDGYQTCAIIKNNPEYTQIPVIMLSSKDGLFDKARGRIVGANEYLTKPFSKDELYGAINDYQRLIKQNQKQSSTKSQLSNEASAPAEHVSSVAKAPIKQPNSVASTKISVTPTKQTSANLNDDKVQEPAKRSKYGHPKTNASNASNVGN